MPHYWLDHGSSIRDVKRRYWRCTTCQSALTQVEEPEPDCKVNIYGYGDGEATCEEVVMLWEVRRIMRE